MRKMTPTRKTSSIKDILNLTDITDPVQITNYTHHYSQMDAALQLLCWYSMIEELDKLWSRSRLSHSNLNLNNIQQKYTIAK